MSHRVLLATSSEQTRSQLQNFLEAGGAATDTVGDTESALAMLASGDYEVFVIELRMPGLDALQLVERLHHDHVPTKVIVLADAGEAADAIRALQLGAYDFLTKPVDPEHLRVVLERAAHERRLSEEVAQLRKQLQNHGAFHSMVSKNPQMRRVFEQVRYLGGTTSTVLIEGETGTGKDVVARAVHAASAPHRRGAWVAVNCAAIPESFFESELFGQETPAGSRRGRLEEAQGGTLFLDNVAEMPSAVQVKLLRVLQERQFERPGGGEPVSADVRLIVASNRNLAHEVRRGKFRADLYHRLNAVRIELPPLRERLEDVPLLVSYFAQKYTRPGERPRPFAPSAMEALLQNPWPGNVRELENTIERACAVARGPAIQPYDLNPEPGAPAARSVCPWVDLSRPLQDLVRELTADLERHYLQRALKQTRGSVGGCAQISGLSRRSISSKLAEYGIDKSDFKVVAGRSHRSRDRHAPRQSQSTTPENATSG